MGRRSTFVFGLACGAYLHWRLQQRARLVLKLSRTPQHLERQRSVVDLGLSMARSLIGQLETRRQAA